MGVTIRHDAPGLIGAYASGLANAQRRRQKYMFDLFQQQSADRPPASRLARSSDAASDPLMGGRWVDPLASPIYTKEELPKLRVQQKAQERAAARKYRLGKLVKPSQGNLLKRFQSRDEIQALQKQEDESRKFAREDELRTQQRQWETADTLRKDFSGQIAKLPDIPDYAPRETRDRLQEIRRNLTELGMSGKFDMNLDENLNRGATLLNDYRDLVGSIEKKPLGERINADTYVDETGTRFQERPGGGFDVLNKPAREEPTVPFRGGTVSVPVYNQYYESMVTRAKDWSARAAQLSAAGKTDEQITFLLGERPIVPQTAAEAMRDGEAVTPPPTEEVPPTGEAAPAAATPPPSVDMPPTGEAAPAAATSTPAGTMFGMGAQRPMAETGPLPASTAPVRESGYSEPLRGEAALQGAIGQVAADRGPRVELQGAGQRGQDAAARLAARGYSIQDYQRARNTLGRIKQLFPNAESLADMPQGVAVMFIHAKTIIDTARGAR